MTAPYVLPFDHHPVNTLTVDNDDYTVPAGKFARIIATLSVEAHVSAVSAAPTTISNGENSTSLEFWADTGDVVDVSRTAASASGTLYQTAQSVAAITFNTAIVGRIFANASAYLSSGTSTITGTALVNYQVEEYNITT